MPRTKPTDAADITDQAQASADTAADAVADAPADISADTPADTIEPAAADVQPELVPPEPVQAPAPQLTRAVALYAFAPGVLVGSVVEGDADRMAAHTLAGNVDPHPDAVSHALAAGGLVSRI